VSRSAIPLIHRLHGCYEALEGGQTMDALVDLTGGLAERYEIKSADPNMYRHLLRAHRAGAFIACSRKVIDLNSKISYFHSLYH